MAVKRRVRPARRRKAATSDIVGNSQPRNRVQSRWRKHYQHLVQLRELIINRKGEQVRDATEERPAFSQHMADAGTDSFDRDFALSRISAEQDALYEITEALNRIQKKTYGICELTGKPIEPGRLEAIPWTRFSAKAEQQLEREGAVQRTRLAPREAVVRTGPAGEPEETTGD